MKTIRIATTLMWIVLGTVGATGAFAEGDATKGERQFRRCIACHIVVDDAGTVLVKGGITGPNLFGVIGRVAGTENDYLNGGARLPVGMYTDAMKHAGAAGLIWTEANLAAFVQDPISFVRDFTGDSDLRVNMSVRLAQGGEDIAAYLAQFPQ